MVVENENTRRFLLEVEDFPDFKPGQFNMLYVYAQGEVPISISSLRSDLIEHTVRLVGEVTEDLFLLKEGDVIGIRGPYGTHFPIEKCRGKDVVLVAGGLGLADIKPVVEFILENRRDFGEVYLLVGAKNPSGLLYREEYKSWDKRLKLLLTVDKPEGNWQGNVGVVTELFRFVELKPEKTVGMMCGPEVMMLFTVKKFLDLGVSEENIYLSMERHMKCAVGTCGHCQFGYTFLCKEGPVFSYSRIKPIFGVKEL
ncbi:NAD(P)H-flavin reductase [Hydrogenivirga caldilitoris]|uniref:NAD(P)H-flavin reductase n=2 Tax=Hydrogenivirga caldilitoris TaxID=246264 RepID=A0A497XTI6_9AQUI|nr:NAD(P)H-flavin reductase [Hydrogenivirga caldilitoris]